MMNETHTIRNGKECIKDCTGHGERAKFNTLRERQHDLIFSYIAYQRLPQLLSFVVKKEPLSYINFRPMLGGNDLQPG